MVPFRSLLFLAVALAAAPVQAWVGQLFNQSGNDWLLSLHPAPPGQVNAPLMAGLDGALHPEQLTPLEAGGDTVAIPRGQILIFWFRDASYSQAHPLERVTFDLVDRDGQTGAVGAYSRPRQVLDEAWAEWDATCPSPYGQFQVGIHHRLLILPA
jgi:hypothetical protein